MKVVNGTQAKNLLGAVLDDACSDLVVIERRGKPAVAMLPADEARAAVLCAYSIGAMPRSVAMKRLGFTWYGQLVDAMSEAGLRVSVPEDVEQRMGDSLKKVFGGRR